MGDKKVILNHAEVEIMLKRLAMELIENHDDFSKTALIGLQPRGVLPAREIHKIIEKMTGHKVLYGELDHTFYRDDFRRNEDVLIPHPIKIDFEVEKKKVVLIDDVLYTGRSVRSAMDALSSFGRPDKIELLCLIDRKFNRETPIAPDYFGKVVDTRGKVQKVKVDWEDNNHQIWLLNPEIINS
jgi:pyrimidine operon attenuation protein / uracil phosphoribosyltransferase